VLRGASSGPRAGGLVGSGEADVDGDGDGLGDDPLLCRTTAYPPTTATVTAVAATRVTA
jgi:hypothetical protein